MALVRAVATVLALLASLHPIRAEEDDIIWGADEEACDMQQTLLQIQLKLGRGNAAAAVDPSEQGTPFEERAVLKAAVPAAGAAESVEAFASADLLIPRRMAPVEATGAPKVELALKKAAHAQDLSSTQVVESAKAHPATAEIAVETLAIESAASDEHATSAPAAEHASLAQAAEQLAEATMAVQAATYVEQPESTRVQQQLAEASSLLGLASSALQKQEACGLAVETTENAQVANLVPANGLICYQGLQREMDRVFCLLQTAPTRALYPSASVEVGSCASRGFDHLEHDPDDCWANSQKWLRSNTDDLDRWKDAQETVWHEYNDAEGVEDFMDIRGGMALSGCICLPGSDVMNAMGDMCAEVQELGLLPLSPLSFAVGSS